MDTAVQAAAIAAQPEVGVPLYVAAHPKKSAGAVLLAITIVLLLVGTVLTFVKFTRGLGHLALVLGILLGATSWYLLRKEKKAKPHAA